MTIHLCATCAVETEGAHSADRICPICADERQYLPKGGQRWTTVETLTADGHTLEWFEVEPDLIGLTTKPGVGIGQQTMIVRTEEGNLLWDPPGLITDEAIDHVRRLGPVVAIAASHPHMYGVQLAWAEVLNAPVLVSAKDAEWLQRRGDAIEQWSGERRVTSTITLYELGGHFPGSRVALWSAGAAGRGVLLAGDTSSPTRTARRRSCAAIPTASRCPRRSCCGWPTPPTGWSSTGSTTTSAGSSTPTPGPWSASPPTGTPPGCGATSTT